MGNTVSSHIRVFGAKPAREAIRALLEPCIIDEESCAVELEKIQVALPDDSWRTTSTLCIADDEDDQRLDVWIQTDWSPPLDGLETLSRRFTDVTIVASAGDAMRCWRGLWTLQGGTLNVLLYDKKWNGFLPMDDDEQEGGEPCATSTMDVLF